MMHDRESLVHVARASQSMQLLVRDIKARNLQVALTVMLHAYFAFFRLQLYATHHQKLCWSAILQKKIYAIRHDMFWGHTHEECVWYNKNPKSLDLFSAIYNSPNSPFDLMVSFSHLQYNLIQRVGNSLSGHNYIWLFTDLHHILNYFNCQWTSRARTWGWRGGSVIKPCAWVDFGTGR